MGDTRCGPPRLAACTRVLARCNARPCRAIACARPTPPPRARQLALGDRLARIVQFVALVLCQAGGAKLAAPQHLAQVVILGNVLQRVEQQQQR